MASTWKTKAIDSIPTPEMSQPMSMAPGPAAEAAFWGKEKMPEPTVEPTMSATSVHTVTVCVRFNVTHLL
ncbi:hypothetical protein GCM10027031_11300 [Corynebacterium atrinae]